jgi:flavorubredoxin
MVISTTADKKMVDDEEQKLMAEVEQIEKEFKRGLEKLNDKLTLCIEDVETRCTSHSRVVNDELQELVHQYIAQSVTNLPATQLFSFCRELPH